MLVEKKSVAQAIREMNHKPKRKTRRVSSWVAEDTIEERFALLADWERFEQAHNGPSLTPDQR
jgi:hypothetical protein